MEKNDRFGNVRSVKCNMCGEHFHEDELEMLQEDDEEYFKGCPNCKTDGYLMDLE